jgi:arginine/lysine/ornithine decarboxylase
VTPGRRLRPEIGIKPDSQNKKADAEHREITGIQEEKTKTNKGKNRKCTDTAGSRNLFLQGDFLDGQSQKKRKPDQKQKVKQAHGIFRPGEGAQSFSSVRKKASLTDKIRVTIAP